MPGQGGGGVHQVPGQSCCGHHIGVARPGGGTTCPTEPAEPDVPAGADHDVSWVHACVGYAPGVEVRQGCCQLAPGEQCPLKRGNSGASQCVVAGKGSGHFVARAATRGAMGDQFHDAGVAQGSEEASLAGQLRRRRTSRCLDHHPASVAPPGGEPEPLAVGHTSNLGTQATRPRPAHQQWPTRGGRRPWLPEEGRVEDGPVGDVGWAPPMGNTGEVDMSPLPSPPPVPPGPPVSATGPTARWGLGDVAIGMGLIFMAQFLGGALVVSVLAGMGGDALSGDGTLPLPVLFAVLPVSWLAMVGWPWWVSRTKGSGSLARDFGVAIRWVDVLVGVAVGLVALAVAAALALAFTAAAGDRPPTNTDIVSIGPSQPGMFVLLFVFLAIGTPIAEEIFFRGLVLGATRKRWGTVIGVITSAVLFGAWHVQDTLVGWAFIGSVTAAYGVLFALSRVWCEGRLGAAIVAHVMVNGVTVLVVGFSQVSAVLPVS